MTFIVNVSARSVSLEMPPMSDTWTKEKRSEVMAAVHDRGNRSTELRMVALFREHTVAGWRRHQLLPGRPDFVFHREKLVVFVDGCFWHGCKHCNRSPATRKEYWIPKLEGNRRRDRRVTRQLRATGWSVLRVWECALRKSPDAIAARIIRKLAERSGHQ